MNKLEHQLSRVLVTATLSIAGLAGCVVHDRDHGGGGGGVGVDVATISARWSLRNMVDGATTVCPTGFDTVQLIMLPVDADGNALDDPAVDLFDCNTRRGTATDLSPDLYQVWIEVRSHDLGTLYAQSLSQSLDLRQTDQTFTTELLNDGGYFQIGWDLIGKTSNRPVQCSQLAGLDTIRTVSTSIADSTRAYDDLFACDDHAAVSAGLLQGSYTIAIDALAGDKSVGTATTLTTKVIASQNRVTDLGTIIIPIDGL